MEKDRLKVVLLSKRYEVYLKILSQLLPDLKLYAAQEASELKEIIPQMDILITWKIPSEYLKKAHNLKWFQALSTGVDHILSTNALHSEVLLTNCRGITAIPISEYTLGIMLLIVKKFAEALDLQKKREYQTIIGEELHGKTLGILGFGSIGSAIAKRAMKAFNMRILALKRTPQFAKQPQNRTEPSFSFTEDLQEISKNVELYNPQELPIILKESDFLVVCLPLTAETRNLLNEKNLRLMKPDSTLINIARAEILEIDSLLKILKEPQIGPSKAVLDVFEHEPLPPDSPLYECENLIITCHQAALTKQYAERACEIIAENYKRFINGKPLLNVINRQVGY